MLPCHIMRGGTSRGLFLPLSALPDDPSARDELCLKLIGSPDPVAFDGLGGGVSSNSKVMFVGPGTDTDIEALFAQVSPTEPTVDWSGNCGNVSAAILPYAIDTGLIPQQDSCTVLSLNTNTLLEVTRDELRFVRPGGEKTGQIFPHGKIAEVAGVQATLIDVANPVAIVRADDFGCRLSSPEEMNRDTDLLGRLEAFRQIAGDMMGLDSAVIPRVAVVDGAHVRMTSVGRIHHALPATGMLALGAAAALGGTLFSSATIIHPKGEVTVRAQVTGEELDYVALARDARIIMRGEVFP